MKTLRGFVSLTLLLILAIACGELSTESTPAPDDPSSSASTQDKSESPPLTGPGEMTFDGNGKE